MIFVNELKSLSVKLKSRLIGDLKKILSYLKIENRSLSVTFCGDKYIQELNARYRHKNRPTDVLSFTADDRQLLGDIIISLDTADSNSQKFKTTKYEELLFLVVHGICHLLGYDHGTKQQEQQMQQLEKKLLAQVTTKEFYAKT